MREVWVEVRGFPRYTVSNLGRLFDYVTCEYVRTHVLHGKEHVNLNDDYGRHLTSVARVVAASFLDRSVEGFDVIHKDGDKSNNAIWNLEVLTHEENIRRAEEAGLVQKRVRLVNLDTGEVYESVKSAGRILGLLSAVKIPKDAKENGSIFKSGGYRLKVCV